MSDFFYIYSKSTYGIWLWSELAELIQSNGACSPSLVRSWIGVPVMCSRLRKNSVANCFSYCCTMPCSRLFLSVSMLARGFSGKSQKPLTHAKLYQNRGWPFVFTSVKSFCRNWYRRNNFQSAPTLKKKRAHFHWFWDFGTHCICS